MRRDLRKYYGEISVEEARSRLPQNPDGMLAFQCFFKRASEVTRRTGRRDDAEIIDQKARDLLLVKCVSANESSSGVRDAVYTYFSRLHNILHFALHGLEETIEGVPA